MKVRICEQCGKLLLDGSAFCPSCGYEQRDGGVRLTRIPQTIEELRAFCLEQGMPLEQMRFFIGEDYRESRAFGIYREQDGTFVVYKNKDNGSRAIRYCGPDEAYAVRELYEKLKSEIDLRRGDAADGAPVRKRIGKRTIRLLIILAVWSAFQLSQLWTQWHEPQKGYYDYDNTAYYYLDRWYCYSTPYRGWIVANQVPEALEQDARDYYAGEEYQERFDASDFSETTYYDDYDWDSGGSTFDSWDIGGTDWSSDW